MATISFDWDQTLFDDETLTFFPFTAKLLREALDRGDTVIIVTSRVQRWADECKTILLKVGIDIPVFSAPDMMGDGDNTKSDVLIREGASIHFDDLADCNELALAKECGIEVRLPPHLVPIHGESETESNGG